MKKSLLFISLIFMIVFVMIVSSCKNGDGVDQNYILLVNISAGVVGSPSTGTYTYSQGDLVNYNYTLQSGYSNLVVTLDGGIVAASGVINMNNDRSLSATAVGGSGGDYDIRGSWNITENYPPDAPMTKVFTFTGTKTSGTVGISTISSATGTYTVSGSTVNFNYSFTDGDSGVTVTHTFSGSFTGENSMSGTSTVTGGTDPDSGTWTATR